MSKGVEVKVPASTANLGSGFDSIGMAFQLYTTIRLQVADRPEVILHGPQLEGLPADSSNLVYRMAEFLFHKANREAPPFKIEMRSDIPLTRGLGSSASAIVGGLTAANHLLREPFTTDQLFKYASDLEGHPDNVGASLFGGIVVAVMDNEEVPYIKIDPLPSLKAIAVIPDFMLPTEKARGVLPETYSRQDTVQSVGHASLLAASLATGQYNWLRIAMRDRIHQPYRVPLIPGMETLLAHAHEYGALGTALSGAGPTIISLIDGEEERLKGFFVRTFAEHGIKSEAITLLPDCEGVKISEDIDTPF
jgi:homoserine kinase